MTQRQLAIAADHIRSGGVIAYPTEYCFGLGCNPFNQNAVRKIIQLKRRSWLEGVIIIAANFAQLVDGTSFVDLPLDLTLDGDGPEVIPAQICDEGAWTNVQIEGGVGGPNDCGDWNLSDGSSRGVLGQFSESADTWTWWCDEPCSTLRQLYCFEQPS